MDRRQKKLCWRSIKNALRLCNVDLVPMGLDHNDTRIYMIVGRRHPDSSHLWAPLPSMDSFTTAEILRRIFEVHRRDQGL